MTYRVDLIELYASNPRKELEQQPGFQSLCRKFMMDKSFQAELEAIRNAKIYVEKFLETSSLTLQARVTNAISLLVRLRRDKKQLNLCHELIVKGYRPSWSGAQQRYFDDAWQKIQYEHDFFLSFTGRYPMVTGVNPINSKYRAFIIDEIGQDEFKTADKKKCNLLAQAIYRLLSDPPIKGFFYPHLREDNAITERKLEHECDSSFVFVQLVQNMMFVPPDGGSTNYCFFEWNRVSQLLKGPDREVRIRFILAESDWREFADLVHHPDYEEWHSHIRTKDKLCLPEARERNQTAFKKIRTNVREKVLLPIKDAWSRLSQDVPV